MLKNCKSSLSVSIRSAIHRKTYLAAFNPRMIGLTGSPEQLAAFAKSYRVVYERIPGPDGNYTMNHSAGIYLFKASGEFQGTVDAHESDETAIRKLKLVIN
jgi:protein SCO1/2